MDINKVVLIALFLLFQNINLLGVHGKPVQRERRLASSSSSRSPQNPTPSTISSKDLPRRTKSQQDLTPQTTTTRVLIPKTKSTQDLTPQTKSTQVLTPSSKPNSKEQGEESQENIDESQDTIADKINNHNIRQLISISKGFKILQDKLEDTAYAIPVLGKLLGPTTSILNLVSGVINEGHDKLNTQLYHGVRKGLGLKGSVVKIDYNHRPVKKQTYHKIHDPVDTQKKIDALSALLDE